MIFDIDNPACLQLMFVHGAEITSSGTTGTPKTIHRSPDNLRAVARAGIDAQELTRNSKILTVMRMTHAGGLLVQTIPGYMVGCDNTIKPFNAYSFLSDFANCTHTSLAPAHMTAIMGTKAFETVDLTGKWITVGSDSVTYEMIRPFVARGATVMINWGMSEIGPVAINHVFHTVEEIDAYSQYNMEGTPIGSRAYCDWQLIDGILHVSGDIVCRPGWLNTGDRVGVAASGMLYHNGRNV